ncbi:MAG: L-seryl-tRNA(Sec) selenium transferase [Omnitrophica WOR_2 bacterium]
MHHLRSLPSVDLLLQNPLVVEWEAAYGRPLTLEAIRTSLDEIRRNYSTEIEIPGEQELLEMAREKLATWTSPALQPVINATGVILHTNLGRAPLSRSALQAIQAVALGYSNLEYDLQKGQRGSRLVHTEDLLKHLLEVEAALVVNNNAAAVLLALSGLARRKGVIISRSQLVEIGGGFRVPDVMKQSGAHLVEVGTTNRVHLSDYEQALADASTGLVMRAHRSNFRIIGFTSEPALQEICQVAHQAGIPVVDDLGSGALLDTARFGLAHEPTVQESLEAGADLVCFSGDKLLGGPQAGIIVGRGDLVAKLKKHPLARAIRADKLCLAALTATLHHYLKNEAEKEIPVWKMIAMTLEEVHLRARNWSEALGKGSVLQGESTVGGGSLPGETLPTYLLALDVRNPNRWMRRLRAAQPPVIARTLDDRVVVDPRTVLPEQEQTFINILKASLEGE